MTSNTSTSGNNFQFAGFWRRFWANLIDSLIIGLVIGFGVGRGMVGTTSTNIYSILGWFIGIFYFVFFWSQQDGQTIGNRVMSIKVIKDGGAKLDLSTAIVRYIGYLIAGIPLSLGFVWAAFDHRKQGWHDKIAKTLVIKTGAKVKKGILFLIVFLVFSSIVVMIFGLTYVLHNTKNRNKFFNSLQFNQILPEASQAQLKVLESSIFSKINVARVDNNLSPLKLDPQICAFAERRLSNLGDQYSSSGFYEDMANPNISRAYFVNYPSASEIYYPNNKMGVDIEDVLSSWSDNDVVHDDTLVAGCVRVSSKHIIFIGGRDKPQ